MELKAIQNRALCFIKKYRYAAIILVIGIIFMLWPSNKTAINSSSETTIENHTHSDTLEHRLANILEKVNGAGKVEVMISEQKGEETIFQNNSDQTTSAENNSLRTETVLVSDSDRAENGLIRQVNPPILQGAVIVCQGADSPSVRLAIVDAVSKVTGLGSDCISVLKMK